MVSGLEVDDMSDVVVTVPKTFKHPSAPGAVGLVAWLAEGDAPGEPASDQEWWFTTYGALPVCGLGGDDRVYIVCEGRVVGYSPLLRLMYDTEKAAQCKGGYVGPLAFVRGAGAVACTIEESVTGFRGWRYRWWRREDEIPLDLSGEIAEAQLARAI